MHVFLRIESESTLEWEVQTSYSIIITRQYYRLGPVPVELSAV